MDGGTPGQIADAGGSEVISVAEVSRLVCRLLDDPRLQAIWVEGEIRDCSCSAKGHCYFSLSEQKHGKTYVIRCAMWRSYARELNFTPGDGKEELAREGLFDEARKLPLPRFPGRVGVVTSATGAARRDIEQVIARRFPVEIVLSPASVQGETAPAEIAAAISRVDGHVDVMIVGRGGGSFEDLFAFNHPQVVRAIAACTTPVVSAVGHEIDHTLADYAADLRAPTPSAAAELVVPDRKEMADELGRLRQHLRSALVARVERGRMTLEDMRLRLQPRRFQRRLDEEMQRVVDLDERLGRAENSLIGHRRMLLRQIAATLGALDPLAPLTRGYCVVEKDGGVVSSTGALSPGDGVVIRMGDGSASARIEEVHHDKNV
jgi:exodeoxyribonuclease VII large subunit